MTLGGRPGEQLRMFVQAKELYEGPDIIHGDLNVRAGQRPERLWSVKRQQTERSGMNQSVAAEGVHEPVQLMHSDDYGGKAKLIDGHHRTVDAYDANPEQYVPVVHHTTYTQFGEYARSREGQTKVFRNH